MIDTIGGRIRWTRLRLQLSLREVGERCGVHLTGIQKYERATEKSMAVATVRKVSAALGCSPEWIALGKPQPSDSQISLWLAQEATWEREQ